MTLLLHLDASKLQTVFVHESNTVWRCISGLRKEIGYTSD